MTGFKGQRELITGNLYENLVMFSKGETFPSAELTISLPANAVIDADNIVATENTATISRIDTEVNNTTKTVKFTFSLGNWNDYKGFFELYESEMGTTGHAINISVPYSIAVNDPSQTSLGTISASGKCELYKYGGVFFYGTKIVNVTTTPLSFNVVR